MDQEFIFPNSTPGIPEVAMGPTSEEGKMSFTEPVEQSLAEPVCLAEPVDSSPQVDDTVSSHEGWLAEGAQRIKSRLAVMRESRKEIKDAMREDWDDESTLGRAAQIGAITGFVVERTRFSEWGIAPIAVSILQETQSPTIAALALGGMVGVTQAAISHSWTEGMNRAPRTIETINRKSPRLVELAEDIAPDQEKHWYSHIREGWSSFITYGVTPFVIAEKMRDPSISNREMHQTAAKLTGKCALTGAGFGYAVGTALVNVDESTADSIMNWLERPQLWLGAAMFFELPRFISKRYNRFKQRNLEKTMTQDEGKH